MLSQRQISFLRDVATNLAPHVHFHPNEKYFPCSVEWYLNRVTAIDGTGTCSVNSRLKIGDINGISKRDGNKPMTGKLLRSISSANKFGNGSTTTDNHSLWPLEAVEGMNPEWAGGRCPLTKHQLKTLAGEPIIDGKCNAEVYCHLTEQDGYQYITYYFFYAYNGGMGPSVPLGVLLDTDALGPNSGYEAHFADLERITAKVKINENDKTVSLMGVVFEWHGNEDYQTTAKHFFSNKNIAHLEPITVYSCLHSHASHHEPGIYKTDTFIASDYANTGGVRWETERNVVFIDTTNGPDWVFYNGRFGASINIDDIANLVGAHVLSYGPVGPAFHSSWNRHTKDAPDEMECVFGYFDLEFNGIRSISGGSYVKIDNAKLFNLSKFTVAALVKWKGDNNGFQYCVSKPGQSVGKNGTGYALGIYNGKPAFGLVTSAGVRSITAEHPIEANRWTGIVISFDGKNAKIYVNGTEVAKGIELATEENVVYAQDVPLIFGREFETLSPGNDVCSFGGKLAEVSIWNSALSSKQIRGLHSPLGTIVPLIGLVGHWKCNDRGDNLYDSSIHKSMGTLLNTTWVSGTYHTILDSRVADR